MHKKYFNSNVVVLFFTIFIDALGWGIILPVFAPIILNNTTHIFSADTSFATRNFWFEFTIAIYCAFMFLNAPVLGSLSDRYGRKKILLLSLGGLTLGFIISAFAIWLNNLALIILGRIISGGTAGSFPIAQAALVDLSTPEQRASRISLVSLANGIGFTCGPIVGALFLDPHLWPTTHYQLPFWIAAALSLATLIFLQIYLQETFAGNRQLKIHFLQAIHSFRDALQGVTARYCWQLFLFMLGYTIFFTLIPTLTTKRFALSGAWIGYFMTYFGAIFTLSLLVLLPRIIGKISLSRLLAIALIIQVIFYLLFIFTPHVNWLWLVIIPSAIAAPISYVVIVTLISKNTDDMNQGKMLGVAGSIAALAWAVGPLLSGTIGSLHLVLGFSLAAILIFLTLMLVKAA